MLNIFNIFAVLLALPLQMAAFVQTMGHIREHRSTHLEIAHEQSDDSDHHDTDEDHDHEHENMNAAEHQHGEGEPVHSHAKELSGIFVQIGVRSPNAEVFLELSFLEAIHRFHSNKLNSLSIQLSLLRPPIA